MHGWARDPRRELVEHPQCPACLTNFSHQRDPIAYTKHHFQHRRCTESKTERDVEALLFGEFKDNAPLDPSSKGFIPRTLLRPQGVGELKLTEVSDWMILILAALSATDEGTLMILLVADILTKTQQVLKAASQIHM